MLVIGASPALAKGPGFMDDSTVYTATVAGPGLSIPIRMSDNQARRMLYLTTSRPSSPFGAMLATAPGRARLGPKFHVDYGVLVDGRAYYLEQDLYPYAPGTAWAYTPAGQLMPSDFGGTSGEITPGWWHSVTVLGLLQSHGLPTGRPGVPPTPSAPNRPFPWGWAGVLFGALSLAIGTQAAMNRRRRGGVPA